MKPEELQAIRERVNKATNRGAWKAEADGLVHISGLGVICECHLARFEPSTYNNAEFIAHAREDVPKLLDYIKELEFMPLVHLVLERDREIEQLNEACGIMAGKIVALESIQEAQKLEVKRSPIEIEVDSDVYVSLLELAYTTKLSLSQIIENCLSGYFSVRGK